MSTYFGFLNLHKPAGFTSHDCIGKLRRLLHMKRIGHGGTLDPLAIGVLPIALGPATRLLNYLPTRKIYRATIRLGITTTTDDLGGDVIDTAPPSALATLTETQVIQALAAFQGPLKQIPPAYSAIQVQGQRCYDLARQGQAVAVPPRSVEVYRITPLAWRASGTAPPEIEVEIHCGPGTYIRSIARDLGAGLQVGGTLAHLHRTLSGGFPTAESVTFADLEAQLARSQFQPLSANMALQHLPALPLSDALAQRFGWGQKLSWPLDMPDHQPPLDSASYLRVLQADGTFLGIGQVQDTHLQAKVVCAPQVEPVR